MRAIKLRCSFEKGYAEGYAAAIEDAVKVARDRMDDRDQGIPYEIAEKIKALLSKGTK